MIGSTAPTVAYQYDGSGRRVMRTEGGQTTYTMYSQSGQLLHKEAGGVGTDYIYAGNLLVATAQGATVNYLHLDLLGSPIDGRSGSTNYTENYTPWGEKLGNPIALADDVGYTGHQSDVATGLTYMQARYYDPVVGRFMATDPVAFSSDHPMTFNRYSYANNNPFRFIDPDGRSVDTIVDAGFIVYDTGRLLGASAAALVGTVTGNDALQSAGLEGIRETAANLGASAASATVPGLAAPMARGLVSEARVLKEMGEVKNTEKVVTSQGRSIPDFQNAKQVGEIKDTQRVSNTAQVRSQREHAQMTGREHTVVTGANTKVSSTVEQQSKVVRRDDLGPQE